MKIVVSLVRDLCDRLHLEKNNNIWGDEDSPPESFQEEFTLLKKKVEKVINSLGLK